MCESQHWTPLHYASRTGFVGLAQVLVDHSADVNAQEAVGWTGLHIASATRDLNIAELLIDSGTNVDSWNGKQKTTLDLASGNVKLEMAQFLIGEAWPYLPVMTEAGHHSTQHTHFLFVDYPLES